MALPCGQKPDHSTISAFVSSLKQEIGPLFCDVLMVCEEEGLLARMFHESLATTADMDVLPGFLRCCTLRRTVQVRLGFNTLRLLGGKPIFTVSRQ